ncbi:hypothetical protein [Hyphomicrobium sp. LHD-15]|uniref:hypothetical protein n=1 Tax=Hyphomicrobium sp. LHD-15 TaxID=3072142 RepID=UPI00280FF0D2|nr:hypothetical protein [Hyphomicrobium sp. LHD-15]MDQ8698764.1 hypothetical protein [Hyphomicrobium sp. LHD-15]
MLKTKPIRACFALIAIAAMMSTAPISGAARASDPPLKSGRDPSGTAIAIIIDGFDYTRPEIASVLARDGEGEAIAWDTLDGDRRPFAKSGSGTEITLAAAARGGVRVVPIRTEEGNRASLAQAIAFAAGTPARIVLAPLSDKARIEIDVLVAAAQKFSGILFVTSLPAPTADEQKKSASVPNLVLLDAKDRQHAAAENIAHALGCGAGDLGGENGADKKRAFLDRLEVSTRSGDAKPSACESGSGKKTGQP